MLLLLEEGIEQGLVAPLRRLLERLLFRHSAPAPAPLHRVESPHVDPDELLRHPLRRRQRVPSLPAAPSISVLALKNSACPPLSVIE